MFQKFFAPAANAIGVDFGTDCLRLAQVQVIDGEMHLIAAASADVPSHVRHDHAARMNFFAQTTRELLAQGKFKGRQAVLGLPSSSMFIQHLRVPRMDDEALKKALPWEARGKLPIDPSHAVLRHLVAGEIYHDQDPKIEVILMAAAREMVNQMLSCAAKAKLDVIGMNVEPQALIDCFGHVYRRKSDADVTSCFVDIGNSGSRAVIARGQQVLFARCIAVGGDHFNRAVAAELKMNLEDVKLMRVQLAAAGTEEAREKIAVPPPPQAVVEKREEPAESEENGFALLSAGMQKSLAAEATRPAERAGVAVMEAPAPAATSQSQNKHTQIMQACREPLSKLVEELNLCRRYYEATFPGKPVDRLIFVGGEARQRALCQHIAKELSLAAQVGDPLVRMGRTTEVGMESGIDRRQPQPAWAVAMGLSMGPASGAPAAVSTKPTKE